jgi:hypothetical protein
MRANGAQRLLTTLGICAARIARMARSYGEAAGLLSLARASASACALM